MVHHPRYLVIPLIGMLLTPLFMALSLLLTIRRLHKEGSSFDLIDAHYYYPDGVAVSLATTIMKYPFTVTARGTDINLIPERAIPRKWILWASRRAAASITVCKALKDRMVELGANAPSIHVLRNGVDLQLFHPRNHEECKIAAGQKGRVLISVGHLVERKGHHLIIEALTQLPEYTLLVAGDGEERVSLDKLAMEKGVAERVKFLGAVTQAELCQWLNAADALVLASSREGWANVLLESMACGTPVVATSIWGTPEVVANSVAGILIEERTPVSIAHGITQLFENYPDRKKTREYAEQYSWDDTVEGLYTLLQSVLPATGSAKVAA